MKCGCGYIYNCEGVGGDGVGYADVGDGCMGKHLDTHAETIRVCVWCRRNSVGYRCVGVCAGVYIYASICVVVCACVYIYALIGVGICACVCICAPISVVVDTLI